MTRPFRPPILDEETIRALLHEPKPVPENWRDRARPRRGIAKHMRGRLEVIGQQGSEFEIQTRQHVDHRTNFSVLLLYRSAEGSSYILVRCNGLHPGGHRNRLEGTEFGTAFHVYVATERYQHAGLDIEGYAEIDETFSTIDQALTRLADLATIETGPEAVGLF